MAEGRNKCLPTDMYGKTFFSHTLCRNSSSRSMSTIKFLDSLDIIPIACSSRLIEFQEVEGVLERGLSVGMLT